MRRATLITLLLAMLTGMALAAPGATPHRVIAWKSGDPQLDSLDARLAHLGKERFSLRLRLRLPAAAADAQKATSAVSTPAAQFHFPIYGNLTINLSSD